MTEMPPYRSVTEVVTSLVRLGYEALNFVSKRHVQTDLGFPPETLTPILMCAEEKQPTQHVFVGKQEVRRAVDNGVVYRNLIYQCGCNNCRVFGTESV